jgi:hypothetical protein
MSQNVGFAFLMPLAFLIGILPTKSGWTFGAMICLIDTVSYF